MGFYLKRNGQGLSAQKAGARAGGRAMDRPVAGPDNALEAEAVLNAELESLTVSTSQLILFCFY